MDRLDVNVRSSRSSARRGQGRLGAILGLIAVAAIVGYLIYSAWPVIHSGLSSAGPNANATASQDAGSGTTPSRLAPFNTENLQVPPEQLLSGGPPKDGIPSLTDPAVVPAGEVRFLRADDRVAGVTLNGEARAYPMRLLNWHEVINDELGGVPIAVVYCPLCDAVSVVDRRINGQTLEFGVSGLLLNSNVVFYDRVDQALWSQVGLESLSGPHAGQSLDHLAWTITSFGDWKAEHPDGTIVSLDTGHQRNYARNPYARYFASDRLMFPVQPLDNRLPLKTRVVGVRLGGEAKAYPLEAITAAPGGQLEDEIAGQRVVLTADGEGRAQVVEAPKDAEVVHTFWFAWAAFHPETELAQAPSGSTEKAATQGASP